MVSFFVFFACSVNNAERSEVTPTPPVRAIEEEVAGVAFETPVQIREGCVDLGVAKLVTQVTSPDEMDGQTFHILPPDAECTDFHRARASIAGAGYRFVGTYQHYVVLNLLNYTTTNTVYDLQTGALVVSSEEILSQLGTGMTATLEGNVLTVSDVSFGDGEECRGGVANMASCAQSLSLKTDIDISDITPTCSGQAREAIEQGRMTYPLSATVRIELPSAKRTAILLECSVPQ